MFSPDSKSSSMLSLQDDNKSISPYGTVPRRSPKITNNNPASDVENFLESENVNGSGR